MKVKRILLGLGGTDYTPVAIQHTVELARLHGAEVTAVTVVDESRLTNVGPVPVGGAAFVKRMREKRIEVSRERIEEAIEYLQKNCAAYRVPYEVLHEKAEPFTQLANLARYHDVMVFGLRSLFDCGFGVDAQDTLTKLVQYGVRPIIAVPNTFSPLRRVLLTYSGSPESAKAIKRFIQSGLWPEIQMKLLTCGPNKHEAEALNEQMARYCRSHGFNPEIEVSLDTPRQRILESASEFDADLIVMGNGIRSYWLDRLLGNTALHVVQHSTRALYMTQ